MVKVSLFMNLKNEKMDKTELLKNRLQASIDFAVKMNENLDSFSWNYQEGVLLSYNEAKLVVEVIKKLTLTDVVGQSEQLPKNNCTLNRQTCGKGSGCKYPHCHI